MIRTLISLNEKDKRWLDSYSRRHGQSTAETVREAIRHFQQSDPEREKSELLEHTAGLWRGRGVDAMEYVKRLRDEW